MWPFVLLLPNGQKDHSVQQPEGDEGRRISILATTFGKRADSRSNGSQPRALRAEGTSRGCTKTSKNCYLLSTPDGLRAKGREDWLKLRQQQTRENFRDLQDRSAERDQDA